MIQPQFRMWVALVAVALLCPMPACAPATLKVMTYNIYHGEHPVTETSNLEGVAELIRAERPDFVALQEVDSLTGRSAALNGDTPLDQVKKLAMLTGMHGYFGKAIDYDGGGYGEGLLTRTPVRTRRVMLPTPSGGEKRALLVATARLSGGTEFTFAGTHLCHQYPENRLAQVRKINEVFADRDGAAVLAGDLNFTQGSEPYDALKQQWVDAAVRAGSPAPTFSHKHPSRRIDYLFLSPEMLRQFEIVEVRVPAVGHSDHRPVVMTFRAKH